MADIAAELSAAIKESGMTIKAVGTKTEIPYEKLCASLKGRREFRVVEYLALCRVLRLDPYFAEEVSA